ncbi:MAG TPA: hypothetical protein VIK78_10815 [Ruminiclostridium sp.]
MIDKYLKASYIYYFIYFKEPFMKSKMRWLVNLTSIGMLDNGAKISNCII